MCKHKTASLRLSIGHDFIVPIYQCDLCGRLLPRLDVPLDIDTEDLPSVDEWAIEKWSNRFWKWVNKPRERTVPASDRRTMLRIALRYKRKGVTT